MSNPYQSPFPDSFQTGATPPSGKHAAISAVKGPAIGLMVVSAISAFLLMLSIPFDVLLLATGGFGPFEVEEGESPRILVRTVWGIAIFAASLFSFWGGLQMKKLHNYYMVRNAAIVAAIPCLGPCCLLGIPFGIWAIVTLGRPEVRSAFES